MQKIALLWLRRDLRLEDNTALNKAAESGLPILPVFIFDTHILQELDRSDARVNFIYQQLHKLRRELKQHKSDILIRQGTPVEEMQKITAEFDVAVVYANEDYEPYARERDKEVQSVLQQKGTKLLLFKDQVIFGPDEILKDDGKPYTVYTPYKRKWVRHFREHHKQAQQAEVIHWLPFNAPDISLQDLGFTTSSIQVRPLRITQLGSYAEQRDYPSLESTSDASPHLRFGTISIRQIVQQTQQHEVYLSELIWREFFMQILYHFPYAATGNFRSVYDQMAWRNNKEEFERWCKGETGYPMVDAGMRELNATGYMHNRVRMVTASFLCKHLLIDWRWGEAWFAQKLLDFELSSNNGNWQWCAGTGCDAAPYFRVFNPSEQLRKFDPDHQYIRTWIPEYGGNNYPQEMVEHKVARERALQAYKEARENN